MTSPENIADQIAERALNLPATDNRKLVAVAGPPASGKTTVSAALLDALKARGLEAGLVAMDGYHLDNGILDARGLRARKGAPETFDFDGFYATLLRLQKEDEVIASTFDRTRDVSVGSSSVISKEMKIIVVEGNYLLLNEAPWSQLQDLWSLSVMITASQETLENRLVDRWLGHGFSASQAREKAAENDIPNALRVLNGSVDADMRIES